MLVEHLGWLFICLGLNLLYLIDCLMVAGVLLSVACVGGFAF